MSKKFTVYTYFWPGERSEVQNLNDLYLAYLRVQHSSQAGDERCKIYEIEAESGAKAKQEALRRRKKDVRGY